MSKGKDKDALSHVTLATKRTGVLDLVSHKWPISCGSAYDLTRRELIRPLDVVPHHPFRKPLRQKTAHGRA